MIKVFGITGTNGKTTASCMLRNILKQKKECALIGTIGYHIGNQQYRAVNTTPGRELLADLFKTMKEASIGQCVMEVSSHGIQQGRVSGIIFSGLGFTNLTRDHLDYHKTMEAYYRIKRQIFLDNPVNAAVNIDDHYGLRLKKELASEVKGYSLKDNSAYFFGSIKEESFGHTKIDFYEDGRFKGELVISIPGSQFAEDAMLAAAMARQANIPFDMIRKGINEVRKIAGRMEYIGSEEDTLGIIDYAHTPDSLQRLLETVAGFKKGKLICVFGCGGFRDKGKRFLMGSIAGTYADYCIITNDNPRGEPPENIAQAIEEGVHSAECEYSVILNRYQAIKRAVSLADKWDIIVVAGKGHEMYQVSGTECIPFDDRKVLKELLEKKYEKTYDERN